MSCKIFSYLLYFLAHIWKYLKYDFLKNLFLQILSHVYNGGEMYLYIYIDVYFLGH